MRDALVEYDGAPPVVDPELLEVDGVLQPAPRFLHVGGEALGDLGGLLEHALDDGQTLLGVRLEERARREAFLDEGELPAEVELWADEYKCKR